MLINSPPHTEQARGWIESRSQRQEAVLIPARAMKQHKRSVRFALLGDELKAHLLYYALDR